MYRLASLTKNNWDKFLKNSNQNNIFCTSKYLDILNKNYKNYVMIDKNNETLIGVIIFENDLILENVPTVFNGIILNEKYNKPSKVVTILKEFIELLLNELKTFRLRSHYNFLDIRGFQWYNYFEPDKNKFKISIFYTGILNIDNKDQFKRNINKGRMHSIKKAIKNNYKSFFSTNTQILNELNQYTFDKQNLKRNMNEFFFSNQLADQSIKNGFGKLLVTFNKNNQPISASLFLYDDNKAYYLVGGSNDEGLNNGGASINIYDQINGLIDNGINTVDFVGLNSPNRGYFKSSFGCESKIYFDIKI